MPRITVLTGSPRTGGNTDMLADAFIVGAKGAGAEVTKISLADKKIHPCIDCQSCFRTKKCVYDDDMTAIYAQLAKTDILVLATPVYFYTFSAQLKAVLDRLHNPVRKSFPIIGAALLAVCADSGQETFDPIKSTFSAICDYEGWLNVGCVTVDKVERKGAIAGNKGLDLARDLGRIAASA